MNKEVKVIFVDFDWTIYDHSIHDFDYESINALKECQKIGIEVIIATARSWHSLKDTGLFNLITPDGLISANGTIIFHHDELIRSTEMPHDVVKKIIKIGVKHHCNFELTGSRTRYVVSKRRKYLKRVYDEFYDTIPETHKYDELPISTILFIGPEKYDKEISDILPTGMHFRRFFDLGADISLIDDDKGQAVGYFLNHLGLSKDNALSFGDSWIDVPMFKATKYSVCLGNGKEEIQKTAKVVGDTIMNHGVAKFLKENILK